MMAPSKRAICLHHTQKYNALMNHYFAILNGFPWPPQFIQKNMPREYHFWPGMTIGAQRIPEWVLLRVTSMASMEKRRNPVRLS
jgi:hypothetical protein